ncbi:collagen alpha-6(VI) chain-like [Branchiostoma floridae x Branchiostoma belcheri]
MTPDLFFVLDGSGSVSDADFDNVKQFVATTASAFTIGLTETRVGVLQYSSSNSLECNLGDHADESSFVSAISTMTKLSGGTSTGAALEYARQNAAWRPAPTPKIMIVLTDGQSQDSVVAASQALAADGVTVFAIGVGNIDQSELLQIANNNPSHVFGLADFNVLARNINLIVSTVCIEPTTQATTIEPTVFPTIEPCNMTPDLFFVLDGSGSVSDADFDKVKQFVATTASAFTIGLTETRVGVLQYSSSNRLECNLGDHADETSFVSAISTMTKLSGGTSTGAALEYARQNAAWRPAPTPKIMIVLTDGQSGDSVVAASQALAADGVTVFAIGVGNIDQSELLQIANNNPGRVFGLADFNVLARNINLIVSTVCIEPTTQATTIDPTELPTLEPCNINSDLFFVLDGSGSVSNADFDKVKQFVKTVASAFTIGLTETRVGVLQYSDSNALECNLGDHADESSFVSAISTMTKLSGGTSTGAALEYARQNAAWRPAPTPKIMIVLTDGQSQDSVVAASQALAADGVTVFAIGVGNIDQSELLQIANNNPSHVFGLADFNVLARNINLIVSTVCIG